MSVSSELLCVIVIVGLFQVKPEEFVLDVSSGESSLTSDVTEFEVVAKVLMYMLFLVCAICFISLLLIGQFLSSVVLFGTTRICGCCP